MPLRGREMSSLLRASWAVMVLTFIAACAPLTSALRSKSLDGARRAAKTSGAGTHPTPRRTERLLKELLDVDVPMGSQYGECQGDCDFDWQCEGDMVCFQRDGYTTVPGCSGWGTFDVDYCHHPGGAEQHHVDYTTLTFVGLASANSKLGTCGGDCDSDDDCRDGLRCFDAPGVEAVPGCDGEREGVIDYCFDPAAADDDASNHLAPTDGSEELLYVGEYAGEPLGKCIGDCKKNSNCRGDLECFEEESAFVPGCSGVRQKGVDYCYDPSDRVQYSGMLTSVDNVDDYGPLDVCMGDCDSDSDCQSGLECAKRPGDGTYDVPGCEGKFERWIEYCYDPNWNPSAGAPPITDEPTPAPTNEPTWAPTTNEPTPAPTNEPTWAPTTDEPTWAPTNGSSLDPTEAPTPRLLPRRPTPAPSRSQKPTNSPTVTSAAPSSRPTDQPTSSPTVGDPDGPEKVFVHLTPFVLELAFLTPTRALAADDRHGRYVLLKENIDEDNELLGIVGSILGDGIRGLGPSSYVGILLEATFLEEIQVDDTTRVAYVFTGKAIFVNGEDFTIPSSEEMETAMFDALDESIVLEELRESGDNILEAVQFVSISSADEVDENNVDKLSEQEGVGPTNNGIKIGAFVLIGVVAACVVVIGGGYVYMKRRDSTRGFWRRPGQRDGEGGRKSAAIEVSRRIIGAMPSPTRTRDLSFDSQHDNQIYFCEDESGVESELSVPDFGDSSSVGATSDWSQTVRAYGYSSGYSTVGDDASGSIRAITPKAPSAEAVAASSEVIFNPTQVDVARQRSGQSMSSFGASVSTGTGSISALGEVRLVSVLQVDDGGADTNDSSHSSSAKENPNHPDFKKIWKRSARRSPSQEQEEPRGSPSIEEQIFGASHPDQVLHISQSQSTDAEEILGTLNGHKSNNADVSGPTGRSICVGEMSVKEDAVEMTTIDETEVKGATASKKEG